MTCPQCQAVNLEGQAVCSHCRKSLVHAEPECAPLQKAAAPSFQIGSLMLLIALIAVLLAVWRFAPGLGVFLLIPTGVGLARTLIEAQRAGDRRMTLFWHVGVFLAAFSITIAIFFASGVAFFLTCLGIASTGHGPYGGNMIGVWCCRRRDHSGSRYASGCSPCITGCNDRRRPGRPRLRSSRPEPAWWVALRCTHPTNAL